MSTGSPPRTPTQDNGTAPLPVWSSNRARHRVSRTGNRQLNAALHRIAMTQARCHPDARAMLARRKVAGDGGWKPSGSSSVDSPTSFTERYRQTPGSVPPDSPLDAMKGRGLRPSWSRADARGCSATTR
ncbi:transposase [Pseudonocardia kujensis]|uniref:transposase n=1 Tax=Pseudonocardia kujensis TaxID=1128675 RepID=UPI0035588AF9